MLSQSAEASIYLHLSKANVEQSIDFTTCLKRLRALAEDAEKT
jgi:hypothetical protein